MHGLDVAAMASVACSCQPCRLGQHAPAWHAGESAGHVRQVGGKPDFADPVVMSADRGGTTIDALCRQIHKTLIADFQYSLVWGTSSKHYPQRRAPALTCPRLPSQHCCSFT